MAFLDRINASEYRERSLLIERVPDGQGGFDVIGTFEMVVFNAEGEPYTHEKYTVTLTPGEKETLRTFVVDKLANFEAETGLTRRPR